MINCFVSYIYVFYVSMAQLTENKAIFFVIR